MTNSVNRVPTKVGQLPKSATETEPPSSVTDISVYRISAQIRRICEILTLGSATKITPITVLITLSSICKP
ncbi:hypothetical protein RchiOBHm_Chr1g0380471 [Rosa chinensis]|uniref:Uncharacterized protein n=1 Tax=Rosa chinensis TaxID=74649 RepID=A0A2P6SNU8_ROSCH|nr:hypothetical protein RchiOBHm_Chr1g0380471 [Rosa chinensis]